MASTYNDAIVSPSFHVKVTGNKGGASGTATVAKGHENGHAALNLSKAMGGNNWLLWAGVAVAVYFVFIKKH